ncbi:MAG TPA: hypothetical protein PLN56_11075 [Methanoregulaceae archaeon]|nr:MAG: hypothetical protein IPI71_09570 [Methanolinea sp.]HON82468.1 hypothetical protein [Methanoregulaceae archaeon]HPD11522.1 hypothetical protein [Methanoregulaceae archaeon]
MMWKPAGNPAAVARGVVQLQVVRYAVVAAIVMARVMAGLLAGIERSRQSLHSPRWDRAVPSSLLTYR